MASTPAAVPTGRGDALLLRHLAALERLCAPTGTAARVRLERELGAARARELVRSLARPPTGERPGSA